MSKDIQAEREKEEEENDEEMKDPGEGGEYSDSVIDNALSRMSDVELFGNTPGPKKRQDEELSGHKSRNGAGSGVP